MTEFLVKTPDVFGELFFHFSRICQKFRLKSVIHLKNRDDCYGDLADVWFCISNVRTEGQQNYSQF